VLLYYFVFAMIGLSIIFVAVYFLNNPLEEPASKIKYPFALSIKPKLASQHDTIQIYYSSINKTSSTNEIALVVVDPFGNTTNYNINTTDTQTFSFPKLNTYNFLLGNYSVILESNRNQALDSLNFRVVPYAPLNAFSSFAFGVGIPLTIGLAITIISAVFQFLFALNSDRNRQFQEKSKWMIDNAKYYLNLSIYSSFISQRFDKDGNLVGSKNDVLYYMILFLENYYKYLEKIAFYYFDDLRAESFASNLDGSILSFYDCIFGDRRILKEFFGREKYQLEKDTSFNEYSNEVSRWITAPQPADAEERSNGYKFYITHFIYTKVLDLNINDLARINYTNARAMKKWILEDVKDERETIKKGIDYLNKLYYDKDVKRYYKHTFASKDILNLSILASVLEDLNKEITSEH
jgi:hypothetical protein